MIYNAIGLLQYRILYRQSKLKDVVEMFISDINVCI